MPATSFGFDLIDLEGSSELLNNSGFFATFNSGSEEVVVGFGDLINPLSSVFGSDIEFGNNSANRITPIEASDFGFAQFDSVQINFGGSAAVANVNFTAVPTPSAVGGGLVLMLGAMSRRRRARA